MNGGIDQLVDTYKGNPQPLQAKVQKAQQGQPPGEIPPDLEEAMALQKIAELRNSAQGQQAMQAGGAQQSVVEKLRQMLGGMQQQAQMAPQMAQAPQQGQMQGQPVMAAGGGSIDQLMSNLGQYYAGGGIVAFSNGGNLPSSGEFSGFSGPTPEQEAKDEIRAAEQERMKKLAELEQKTAFLKSAGAPQAQAAQAELAALKESMRPKPSPTDPNFRRLPDPRYTGTAATSPDVPLIMSGSSPAANKSSAGGPNVNAPAAPTAPAKPATEPESPLEAALNKSIMDALAKDPEAIRKKAMEQNREFMGLDALLKPAQDRASAREARIKEIQASRQPLWIDALMSANKPAKGGIAGVLQNMAVGAISGKQNYELEDLKFLDELNKLNSEIDKAKIEGRYKDVAAGKEAVKDLIADRRQAEQSGTSLLNTKAVNKSREQTALEGRLSREQTARIQAQNVALAREERIRQFNEEQLRKLRQNDVDLANKIEAAIAKRTGQIDLQLQGMKLKPEEEAALLARRNAIVKQVRAEYPSASSAKPTESQFLAAARAANPGVSEADLKAYYKQNYGS
jgi:hypothetical protein